MIQGKRLVLAATEIEQAFITNPSQQVFATGTGTIVVLGAGLVGCYIGGLLTGSGPVTLVGRDSLVAELAAHGLWTSKHDAPPVLAEAGHLTFTNHPAALPERG